MALPPPTKYLLDWFVRYTKNRDLIFRKISEIKEDGKVVVVKRKDGGETQYVVEPFPEDVGKTVSAIPADEKGLVMYNSKDNFDKLLAVWKDLSGIKDLTVFFVNPFSKLEKRWIIKPYIHGKITEPESLKEGLNSMYIMVDPISQSEIEEMTK